MLTESKMDQNPVKLVKLEYLEEDQMTVTLNLPELGDSSESRLVSIVVPADSESTDGTVRAAQKQLRAKLYRIVVVLDQSFAGQPLEEHYML